MRIDIDPAKHKRGCRFRRAAAGRVAIECPHGYDVCPKCDPCTCHAKKARSNETHTPSTP